MPYNIKVSNTTDSVTSTHPVFIYLLSQSVDALRSGVKLIFSVHKYKIRKVFC